MKREMTTRVFDHEFPSLAAKIRKEKSEVRQGGSCAMPESLNMQSVFQSVGHLVRAGLSQAMVRRRVRPCVQGTGLNRPEMTSPFFFRWGTAGPQQPLWNGGAMAMHGESGVVTPAVQQLRLTLPRPSGSNFGGEIPYSLPYIGTGTVQRLPRGLECPSNKSVSPVGNEDKQTRAQTLLMLTYPARVSRAPRQQTSGRLLEFPTISSSSDRSVHIPVCREREHSGDLFFL